jgi:hypothetical protein
MPKLVPRRTAVKHTASAERRVRRRDFG